VTGERGFHILETAGHYYKGKPRKYLKVEASMLWKLFAWKKKRK